MGKASDFIRDHTKRCSNEAEWDYKTCLSDTCMYQPWLTPDNALAAVEIERQEVIEKVLDFFENDLCCYIVAQDFIIDHERLETDFKKYMKGD